MIRSSMRIARAYLCGTSQRKSNVFSRVISVNFVFVERGDEPIPPRSLPMYEPQNFKSEFSAENPRFKCGFLSKKTLVLSGILEIGQILEKIIIELKRMEPLYVKIIKEYLYI